jgi:histidine triad (HIT) family protein
MAMTMADCIFCKITKKEIPAEIIYEDETTIAVLDVNPRAPGHTMILPKIHAENILDLSEAATGLVFNAVKKTTEILKNGLKPDGFTTGINQGRAGGQIVDHLHIHIIPRWENDGGGSIHSVVNNPPKKSINLIKQKILNPKS